MKIERPIVPTVRVGSELHVLPARRAFQLGGSTTNIKPSAQHIPQVGGIGPQVSERPPCCVVGLTGFGNWHVSLVGACEFPLQIIPLGEAKAAIDIPQHCERPTFLAPGDYVFHSAALLFCCVVSLPDASAFKELCLAEEATMAKQTTMSLREFVTERAKSARGEIAHAAVRDWEMDLDGLKMTTAAHFFSVVEGELDGDDAQTAGRNAESGEWNPDMSLHFVFRKQAGGTHLQLPIVAPRTDGPEAQSAVQTVVRLDFLDGKFECEGVNNPLAHLDGLYVDQLAAIVQTAASRRAGAK